MLTGDERQAEIDGLLHLLRFNGQPAASSPIVEERHQRPAWDTNAQSSTWDTHPGFVGALSRRRLTSGTRHSSDHTPLSESEREHAAPGSDEALRAALAANRRARAMTMDSVDTIGSGSGGSGAEGALAQRSTITLDHTRPTPVHGLSVASSAFPDDNDPSILSAPSTIVGPSSATPTPVNTNGNAAEVSSASTVIPPRRHSGRSFLSRIGRHHHHHQGSTDTTSDLNVQSAQQPPMLNGVRRASSLRVSAGQEQ